MFNNTQHVATPDCSLSPANRHVSGAIFPRTYIKKGQIFMSTEQYRKTGSSCALCTATITSAAMNGDAGDGSRMSLYPALVERCRSLEASLASLQQQFDVLLNEQSSASCEDSQQEVASDSGDLSSFPGWGCVPGAFFYGSPYKNVLEYMGHAVHVSRPGTEEIIYW